MKSATAVWDSWMAAQHFESNRSVPDRKMLNTLLNCKRQANPGDLELLGLMTGLTIGEAVFVLLKVYYS